MYTDEKYDNWYFAIGWLVIFAGAIILSGWLS